MEKIDLKDRKILYQLDLNSRQSYSQIGKKVGLHKNKVIYRIKRMEDHKIISDYWTVIDSYKLGYDVFRYYLILQNTTPEKKMEMINHFADYKNTWVVGSCKGMYDIALVLWVPNIPEFYRFWDDVNDKFGDYFAEKLFSIYIQAHAYPKSYLLGEDFNKSDRECFQEVGGGKPVLIDDIDYQILDNIAVNAKIPLIDLGKKIGCSSQAAAYRLKNLEKIGVIKAYRVGFDITHFGLQHFKVDFFLNEPSKRKQIWDWFKYNPFVTFINTSAGYADIEVEFNIENTDKLLEIVDELSSKFPDVIKKYLYFSAKKNYKLRCIPEK